MARSQTLKNTAIALAGAIALTASMPVAQANAGSRHHHHYHGGDVLAAGIVGALVGAVIASPTPAYAVPVYPAPEPVYVSPVPVYDKYFEVYDPPPVIAPAPVYSAPGYAPGYTTDYSPGYAHGHHAGRVPLSEYSRRHHAPAPSGGPRVITYDDTVGGGHSVASTEPWSPGWYEYCRGKFRSFDAKSGTYLGYDGKRHFCVVR